MERFKRKDAERLERIRIAHARYVIFARCAEYTYKLLNRSVERKRRKQIETKELQEKQELERRNAEAKAMERQRNESDRKKREQVKCIDLHHELNAN